MSNRRKLVPILNAILLLGLACTLSLELILRPEPCAAAALARLQNDAP